MPALQTSEPATVPSPPSAPVDAYDAIPAMNWSSLKHYATSPLLYRWRTAHPREDTAALRLGRLIHVAVLEPDRWAQEYASEPEFDLGPKPEKPRNPGPKAKPDTRDRYESDMRVYEAELAAWSRPRDEWFAAHAGVELLEPREHALVSACASAVRSHRVAMSLLQGTRREEIIQWTDEETGLRCKMRGDIISPFGIGDLKSTSKPTLRLFRRAAAELLYHGQCAWYHDGGIAARVLPRDARLPFIIGVQSVEPFDVYPIELEPFDLGAGRALWRRLLRRHVECEAAGWWPGEAPELERGLQLPPWAPGAGRSDHEEHAARGDEWA